MTSHAGASSWIANGGKRTLNPHRVEADISPRCSGACHRRRNARRLRLMDMAHTMSLGVMSVSDKGCCGPVRTSIRARLGSQSQRRARAVRQVGSTNDRIRVEIVVPAPSRSDRRRSRSVSRPARHTVHHKNTKRVGKHDDDVFHHRQLVRAVGGTPTQPSSCSTQPWRKQRQARISSAKRYAPAESLISLSS